MAIHISRRAHVFPPSTLSSFTSRDPLFGDKMTSQSQDGYDYATDPSGKAALFSGVGGIFDPVNIINYFFPSNSGSACPAGYANVPGFGGIQPAEPNYQRVSDQAISQIQARYNIDIHVYKPDSRFDIYYDKTPGPNYGQMGTMLKGQQGDFEPIGLRLLDFPEVFF
jgi:hypothetical protein